MSNQFPHREADHAPFDEGGWRQLQRDIDKLFRAMQITRVDQDNIDPAGTPTFAGVTINGNVVVTGTVDGVDVSAHAARHQNAGGDEVATATPAANAIPKALGNGKLADGWGWPLVVMAQNNSALLEFFLSGAA